MSSNPSTPEPASVEAPSTSDDVAEQAERPDWEFWRRRAYCRVWQAALLSLNVQPSSKNRKKLKGADKSEYQNRKKILAVNRGLHPSLPKIEHAMEGHAQTEKYVSLSSVLVLATEQNWSNVREFEAGFREGRGGQSRIHTLSTDEDEDEDEPADVTGSKGARYAHERLGAALELIEQILTSERKGSSLLNGKKLNVVAVAKALRSILERHEIAIDRKVHGQAGVRKALGNALKALRSHS